MATQHEFYRERAVQARREADEAELANVRERCLRSASVWEDMAARARRTERMQRDRDAEKAAARAAE